MKLIALCLLACLMVVGCTEYPPYNPNATCPKCGSPSVGVWWDSNSLRRGCASCGYSWHERGLDASQVEKN
jgi:hypothetical protein